MKETEARNHKQMGRHSTIIEASIVKMSVLSKTVYSPHDIFIKILAAFFTQKNPLKYFLKFILKKKIAVIPNDLNKKKKAGDLILPVFDTS